jgi:uncharacterized coiled-coil DUF342 family protein
METPMKFLGNWKIKSLTKTLKNWKKKAKERRLETKNLKKRVEELTESRDTWREKYETTLEELKKNGVWKCLRDHDW